MKHIRKSYTCKYCDWPEDSGVHSVPNAPPNNRFGLHDFVPRHLPDAPPDPKPGQYEPGDIPSIKP